MRTALQLSPDERAFFDQWVKENVIGYAIYGAQYLAEDVLHAMRRKFPADTMEPKVFQELIALTEQTISKLDDA